MDKFKFSVVIAAYNSDLWISKTINSLIDQTLDFKKNIQIIIVNDKSSSSMMPVQIIRIKFAIDSKQNIRKILST